MFPTLTLIVVHGERSLGSTRNWLSATAMREALQFMKQWPPHLKYVLDSTNPSAANVVILTSYKILAAWTLNVEPVKMKSNKFRKKFSLRWANLIGIVMVDKTHCLRNPTTQFYQSIKHLGAGYYWFLTATPVINTPQVQYLT